MSTIFAQTAAAAEITVTTTADEFDFGNTGPCALREAIAAANTDSAVGGCVAGSGADRVILPAGLYTLVRAGSEEDNNFTGDLDITGTVDIVGSGWDQTVIDANDIDRVLQIFPNSRVHASQLSVVNGQVRPPMEMMGGGIYNEGQLTMTHVILRGHNAVFASALFNSVLGTLVLSDAVVTQNTSSYSGAIGNNGFARLMGFRVVNNNAIDSGYGTLSNGGNGSVGVPGRETAVMELMNGVIAFNTSRHRAGLGNLGTLSATNLTISGNLIENPFEINEGIALMQSGIATFTSVTLVNHALPNAVLLIGPTYWGNSIISQMQSCEAAVVISLGHNLTDCTSEGSGFSQSTDKITPRAQFGLLPLRDDGGVDVVHELTRGSPAHNAGTNALCPLQDQRGLKRPQNSICDIGAAEFPDDFEIHAVTIQVNSNPLRE